MRKLLNTRKKVIIAGAAAGAVVLGTGGAAYAYFTASGTGSGNAAVGSTGTWNVQQTATSGGPLFPGSGTVVDTFTITNTGTGDQKITTATLNMATDSGTAESGTYPNFTDIANCQSTWFSPTYDSTSASPVGTTVAGGATTTVKVDVTMPSADVNQNACQSKTPAVVLAIG